MTPTGNRTRGARIVAQLFTQSVKRTSTRFIKTEASTVNVSGMMKLQNSLSSLWILDSAGWWLISRVTHFFFLFFA